MLNVCLVQDLILLWDLMSGYLQSEPPSSITSFRYHVLLTYRSELHFFKPCRVLGCKSILLFCHIYWYEATAVGIHFSVLTYSICFSKAVFVGDEQIMTNKFELPVLAVLQQTVDCHPAVGSRNRWTLSGSWARQGNKPASGHCWLMQNLPLVLPHSSTVLLLHWKLSTC